MYFFNVFNLIRQSTTNIAEVFIPVLLKYNEMSLIQLSAIFITVLITGLKIFECLNCDLFWSSNKGVYKEESNTLFVEYGQPFELFCGSLSTPSKNLEVYDKCIYKMNTTIINSRKVKLNLSSEKQLSSFCCIQQNNTRCSIVGHLGIDDAPKKISNFSCRSYGFQMLRCTWSDTYKYLLPYYKVQIKSYGLYSPFCKVQRVENHKEEGIFNIYYCDWSSYGTEAYYPLDQSVLTFYMVIISQFGLVHQYITIDHYSIVEVAKPFNLTVLATEPHSVSLAWNVYDYFIKLLPQGLVYRMEYRITDYNPDHWHQVDTSAVPEKNQSVSFEVQLPCGNMEYEVRLGTKSKTASDDFWSSENATVKFWTPPVPTPVQLFDIQVCS